MSSLQSSIPHVQIPPLGGPSPHLATAAALEQDPLATWGTRDGDRYYSLEVAQNPLRARMCGFGDKDRRPLAPAAVAKMVVRDKNQVIIEPDELVTTFFVVMVELWTADGTQNVTMIPQPSGGPPPTFKGTKKPTDSPWGTLRLDVTANFPSTSQDPFPAVIPSSGFSTPSQVSVFGPPLPPSGSASGHPAATWTAGPIQLQGPTPSVPPLVPGPLYQGHDPRVVVSPQAAFDPTTSVTSSTSQLFANTQQTSPGAAPQSPPNWTSSSEYSDRPPEVHNLVGPIHTSAAKLLDDHERSGVFFLFQDLSVRTEGHFRLRMKLLTVAPIGSTRVGDVETPVLAQTATDVFTVFPVKNFPGVPDMTALSATFGRQGQKLPLRVKARAKDMGPSRKTAAAPADEDDGEGSDVADD